MKTYRMNALMAGTLYILGTVFGILGAITGGDVLISLIAGTPLTGVDTLGLVATNSARLTGGALLTLLMGISLMAMTVFLYPILRKDSEELALGMLLFRGALEGTAYLISTLAILTMVALGNEYVASGASSAALQSIGQVLYQFMDVSGAVGGIVFLIGATFLYISFYRTRLIPRWLTIWGLVGVVCSLAAALSHFFHVDTGYAVYLEMVIMPQELVMGLWLIVKGFDQSAIARVSDTTDMLRNRLAQAAA